MSKPFPELTVPARYRIVIEGALEHQLAVLDALRSVAAETGSVIVARGEAVAMLAATTSDADGNGGLASIIERHRSSAL